MAASGRRVAKNQLAKKVSAVLVSLALAAGTVVAVNSVASASGNFTVPAGGLDFTNSVSIENLTSGTIRTYENVDGNGTVAKVEVTALSYSMHRSTGPNWAINVGSTFLTSDPATVNYKIAYKLDTDGSYTFSNLTSASTTRVSLTNLRQVTDRSRYEFVVVTYDGAGNEIVGNTANLVISSSSTSQRRAVHTYSFTTDRLNYLDVKDNDSTVIDGFLRAEIQREDDTKVSSAAIKISFESSQGVARTFTSLRLNSYDVDNDQFIEASGVDIGDITVGTNILSVTETGSRKFLIRAKSTNTSVVGSGNASFSDPASTSYSAGKVSIMYSNISQLAVSFGLPAGDTSASFEFDLGDRVAAAVGGSAPASTSPNPPSTPQVVALDVNPTKITVASEIVTVLGANLNMVESVWIGGVNVPIKTVSMNRLQVRAPSGLSGLVDLELKSSLNNVLMTKKLSFGGTTAAGTRQETLIVGGFAHNSRVLTPRMQARIDRWLAKHSDLSTLTCTGFTSLPRRTSDVALSTNRGKTACAYSEGKRAGIESSVSQGIEDPRPGSNVRRVRLVLTP
jgi:hypothetical protein